MLICIAALSFIGAIIFSIISFSNLGLMLTSVICILSTATMILITRFAEKVNVRETEIKIADGTKFRIKIMGNYAFWNDSKKSIYVVPVYEIKIFEPSNDKPKVTRVEVTHYYPSWVKNVCDFGLFGGFKEETTITYYIRAFEKEIEYVD